MAKQKAESKPKKRKPPQPRDEEEEQEIVPDDPPARRRRGRTLTIKLVFNKPGDEAFNTLTSNDILDDVTKMIKERYFWFSEAELDVVWCADRWEP